MSNLIPIVSIKELKEDLQSINLQLLFTNGSYYYPAGKHYNNVKAIVICDICKKENIIACIGYDKYDACLECVNKHLNIKNEYKLLINKYLKPYYYDSSTNQTISDDILQRILSQKITQVYLNNWKNERSATEIFIIPNDVSYEIIKKMFNDLVI